MAPQAPIHVVTPAELGVYGAFLQQAWAKAPDDGPLARQTVLLENDALDNYLPNRRAWENYILKRIGGQGRASAACLEAFLRRPTQVVRFYEFPVLETPIRLVRSDVLKKAFDKGWDAYWDAYPKTQGVLTLGVIAQDLYAGEALFLARMQCGRRCGYRDIVFMRKVNGAWTLIMKEPMP